jgi:hypothetical protein
MASVHPKRKASPKSRVIVSAAIHPAIGIARVGDSRGAPTWAPEVAEPEAAPAGSAKDRLGRLRRQAVRFRVFGYNAAGKPVAELTSQSADITWRVHVANSKAAWYEFHIALDIPQARMLDPRTGDWYASPLRNYSAPDRSKLVIDPGPRSIRGSNVHGRRHHLSSGRFYGKRVYLGELRTDPAGRLIFIGGRGKSSSVNGQKATDDTNNDGWHDDIADGPVTATVRLKGRKRPIPCKSAWVVSAPPSYAPDFVSITTLYDLLRSRFVDKGWLREPKAVYFEDDILPILRRMSALQWVNRGFAAQFGFGAPYDFNDPGLIAKLGTPPADPKADPNADPNREIRQKIANSFRVAQRDGGSPEPWPWIYGDASFVLEDIATPCSVRTYQSLAPLQMRLLGRWAAGAFLPGRRAPGPVPRTIDQVPLQARPGMLDRAALTFCIADAFHPGGAELTWPIRNCSMFTEPFRISPSTARKEPGYGPALSPERATGPGGPLYAQPPGGLTRWLAVPWQTDTASCQSGYDADYDPALPTFWPARVPNHVLTWKSYSKATRRSLPAEDRLKAFHQRGDWMRRIAKEGIPWETYINEMVTKFSTMGVVEAHHAPGGGVVPDVIYVESP